MIDLIGIITAAEPGIRNQSLERACADLSARQLLEQCAALDAFRRRSVNLYQRVRALFFLYAIHRFHLPPKLRDSSLLSRHASHPFIPFKGYEHLLQRRFEEAIDHFLEAQNEQGPNDAISSALALHGRAGAPRPPVEAYLRVIAEPVLRLVSVDLGVAADITNLADVFDFAKDYLGLLKAAVIAAGLVPPGIEGSGQSLAELLARIVGPGRGLEIVSSVNDIPKGSRLAVSTTLLAALISLCMRATGQAASLTGPLQEHERRLVLARAILGEWLGGSGGGWQDSGGVWPGMKLIEGVLSSEGDPEFGISRGRLMPKHRVLDTGEASVETRRKLQESLV